MKITIFFIIALTCSVYGKRVPRVPISGIAVLDLSDVVKGNITFTQTPCAHGVLVTVHISGLSPGKHGFHIHEKGDLSGGCASTGGHYNPDSETHGGPDDHIRHAGDLGNIVADANGQVSTSYYDDDITLYGSRSIVGRAVVVHASEDDLGKGGAANSLMTGNSGARIACGVIGAKASA